MAKPSVVVKRAQPFDDVVRELEESCPGVRAAIDVFIDGLKNAGADLPIRPVDANGRTHHVDDASLGAAGRGRFGVFVHAKVTGDSITFTLIDVWVRAGDLPIVPVD